MTPESKVRLMRVVDEMLRPIGFEKHKKTWVRKNGEVTQDINLQKSAYSNKYWLRLYVYIDSINLKSTLDMPPSYSEPEHFFASLDDEVLLWTYTEADDALSFDLHEQEVCYANVRLIIAASADLLTRSSTIEGLHSLANDSIHAPRVNGHVKTLMRW